MLPQRFCTHHLLAWFLCMVKLAPRGSGFWAKDFGRWLNTEAKLSLTRQWAPGQARCLCVWMCPPLSEGHQRHQKPRSLLSHLSLRPGATTSPASSPVNDMTAGSPTAHQSHFSLRGLLPLWTPARDWSSGPDSAQLGLCFFSVEGLVLRRKLRLRVPAWGQEGVLAHRIRGSHTFLLGLPV